MGATETGKDSLEIVDKHITSVTNELAEVNEEDVIKTHGVTERNRVLNDLRVTIETLRRTRRQLLARLQ